MLNFINRKNQGDNQLIIEKNKRIRQLMDQMTEIIVEINQIVNSNKEAAEVMCELPPVK